MTFERSFDPRRARHRGFSFAEVLFAVAVLGIGFIMVAAIFPVAIQQTQYAIDETIGTAAARNGMAYIQGTRYINSAGLPYTAGPAAANSTVPADPGRVFSFNDPRMTLGNWGPPTLPASPGSIEANEWDAVKHSLIASDPRFAVVPLYSRDNGANFAKLFVFCARIRTRDAFHDEKKNGVTQTDVDRVPAPANTPAELEPKPVDVQLQDGGTATADHIWIGTIKTGDYAGLDQLSKNSNAVEAATEGAYVVISDDRVGDDPATTFINEYGKNNGRIYQLGPEVVPAAAPPASAAGVTYREFELVAGQDMASAAENIPASSAGAGNKSGIAFVIGRGYGNPINPGTYSGGSMVVQHYENVVSLP